jgi:hypothetical protein
VIEYFTAEEANVFTFYRIPKELFTHPKYKDTSAESKILYGLLLDRNSLSLKNGWMDERGYIYIYFSREEVMETLGVSKPKACALFKNLNDVDLIEEIRQGLNKPNKIYVGKFLLASKNASNTDNTTEVKKIYLRRSRKFTSGGQENLPQEVKKIYPSNTDLKRDLYAKENNYTHIDLPEDLRDLEDTKRDNITPRQSTVCGEKAPAEVLRKAPKAFLPEKSVGTPLAATCTPAQHSCVRPPQQTSQGQVKNTPAQTAKPAPVDLTQLQQDIEETIGETIVVERIKKLVHSSSLERIRFHLEHWPIHQLNQRMPGAGYFLTVVENDIPPVAPPEKKPYQATTQPSQRDMFEQREYSDEFLESFYANLTEDEEAEEVQPEEPTKNTAQIPPVVPGEQKQTVSCEWQEWLEYQEEQARIDEWYALQLRPRKLQHFPELLDKPADDETNAAAQSRDAAAAEQPEAHNPAPQACVPANAAVENLDMAVALQTAAADEPVATAGTGSARPGEHMPGVHAAFAAREPESFTKLALEQPTYESGSNPFLETRPGILDSEQVNQVMVEQLQALYEQNQLRSPQPMPKLPRSETGIWQQDKLGDQASQQWQLTPAPSPKWWSQRDGPAETPAPPSTRDGERDAFRSQLQAASLLPPHGGQGEPAPDESKQEFWEKFLQSSVKDDKTTLH